MSTEGWIAVASVVNAVTVVLLAAITFWYAKSAKRQAEAARRVAFWASGLSNRPKRPHLHRAVNVRIIGLKPRSSYVVRFVDEFCKTRQVCNANRKSDSKEAISDGTARQETL